MAASTVRAIIGGVSGSDDAQRLVAVVHGNVQGVGFRWYVQREADRIGLVGWVANRRDGRVEVVAEGPEDALRSMVATLHDGPAGASVASVDVRYEPARHDLRAFDIRVGEHRGD